MRGKINNIRVALLKSLWFDERFFLKRSSRLPRRRAVHVYIYIYAHIYTCIYRRTERNAKIVNDIKFFALNCIPFAWNSHISISALLNFPRVRPFFVFLPLVLYSLEARSLSLPPFSFPLSSNWFRRDFDTLLFLLNLETRFFVKNVSFNFAWRIPRS